MIDFHSHILPSVDDGSQSVEESLRMLRAAWDQGVRRIVATPHFYADEMVPKEFLVNRQRALEQIGTEDADRIFLGAEVAYFDNMSRSEALQQMQIGQTGLILVEMPFMPWTDRIVEDVCRLADRQGLTPVLAHVERYRQKSQIPRYRDVLLNCGALFQCNAGAFLSFGSRSWTLKQMKNGCVHFLGSDCHNMTTRAPRLGEAAQVIEKKLGRETLEEIEAFSAQVLGINE